MRREVSSLRKKAKLTCGTAASEGDREEGSYWFGSGGLLGLGHFLAWAS
jgi:hypothetical protein